MGKKRFPGDKDLTEADLVQKILVWLPVVSLLRFKSVSKSWCALIQTSSFIDLHLNSSSSSNKFGSFILHVYERFRENLLLISSESECVSFGSGSITLCSGSFGSGSLGGGGGVVKLDNLGFPSSYKFFGKIRPIVMVVGSGNGLICLYDKQSNEVSLWNPATRQFRILPKSLTFDGDCLHHRFFAFGFDAKTKDYKVVLLSGLRLRPRIIDGASVGPMECLCRVQVYSKSTDSWKFLEGINVLPGSPFHYPPPDSSSSSELLYLNGSCFFMAKFLVDDPGHCIPPEYNNDRFIISLDLTNEIITPIQLPYHCASENLSLCFFDDKLALFMASNKSRGTDYWGLFDILVLNEKNCSRSNNNIRNYESWTKLNHFRIKLGFLGERIIPRGISNDGVFVFLETGIHHGSGKVKLYNLVTMKDNFIFSDQVLSEAYAIIYSDQVLSKAHAYKPSLVSIIGGNGGGAAAADRVIENGSTDL